MDTGVMIVLLLIGFMFWLIYNKKKEENNKPKNPVYIKKSIMEVPVTVIDSNNIQISKSGQIRIFDEYIWINSDKVTYDNIHNVDMQSFSYSDDGINVGKAIIGGALFGGVGAVIGSQSKKEKEISLLTINYTDYRGNSKQVYLAPFKVDGKFQNDNGLYSIRKELGVRGI